MSRKRLGAVAAVFAVAAGGTTAAIAATTGGDPKDAEQAVIDDAAKRLDVTPSELRGALAKARDAELDREVKAGRLTQEQADAIKQRRARSGLVLGGAGRPGFEPRHHRRGFGPGGPGRFGPGPGLRGVGGELAKALGVTQPELRKALRQGKTIAEIAKDNGKSLDDVRASLRAAAKQRLDKAVADKKLTQAQADEILAHVEEHLKRLDDPMPFGRGERGPGGPRWDRDHDGPPGPPPGGPDTRPGVAPAAPSGAGLPS
jgi:hypothetical protein